MDDEDRKSESRQEKDGDGNRMSGWLPYLLLPVAFLLGWWLRAPVDEGASNNQPGVGGGPPTIVEETITPTPTPF